jgi:magnesium-transporting ATPase (P-type)
LENYQSEYEIIKETKIDVLHWYSFNSQRKRSTLVMRFKNYTLDDLKHLNKGTKVGIDFKLKRSTTDINQCQDLVFVFSKGAPDEIFEICREIFSNN